MQGKFFPNFTSILFDYLFITWETNYVRNRGFWTCLSWFYRIDQELHALESWLKFRIFQIFRQNTS